MIIPYIMEKMFEHQPDCIMNHWCLNSSLVIYIYNIYIYIHLSPYSFRRIKTQSCSRCSSGTTRASLPTTATCSLGKACWPICRSWGGTALMLVWRFWRLSMRRPLAVYCSCMLFPRGFGWIWHFLLMFTNLTCQFLCQWASCRSFFTDRLYRKISYFTPNIAKLHWKNLWEIHCFPININKYGLSPMALSGPDRQYLGLRHPGPFTWCFHGEFPIFDQLRGFSWNSYFSWWTNPTTLW